MRHPISSVGPHVYFPIKCSSVSLRIFFFFTDTDSTEHTTRDVMVVSGQGVIGFEPLLTPETPAFQYSSHVDLQSSCGYME